MLDNNFKKPELRKEFAALLTLAFPIIVSSILLFALNVEDQLVVGHLLKKEDLAAVAIGTTYFNLFWYMLIGLMSAVDTFTAQSYGTKSYSDVGLWSQRGLFVCLVACIPFILISLTCTETIVRNVFNQSAIVSSKTALFVTWLMPGLPFFVVADILRRWLQVQGHLSPAVISGVIVNFVNVGLNMLLVSHVGLVGSSISTSLSRILQVILLVSIIRYRELYKIARESDNTSACITVITTTWPMWSWKAVVDRKSIVAFLWIALPGAAMLLFEAGAFETSTLIVGRLNDVNILDAHFALLTLCGFSFVSFPLSISIAGCIRVGHLLGSSKPQNAKMAAWLSVLLGTSFMAINGIVFASCKDLLGYIFTTDDRIIKLVGKIAPIAACFQIVDGIQGWTAHDDTYSLFIITNNVLFLFLVFLKLGTSAGALRGCGLQKNVMCTNFLGFWMIGIPFGALLAFNGSLGVYGVWWGLVSGLTVAAGVSAFILCRVDWSKESELAKLRVLPDIKIEENSVIDGGVQCDVLLVANEHDGEEI
jgi:MATE family multidrug resistance protein